MRRLVIRLWATPYRVDTANDPPAPLWIGMVTLERLSHPAGIAALAMTDQDFAAPAARLAQFLQKHGVVGHQAPRQACCSVGLVARAGTNYGL